jgi:hypothetical protein
LDHAETEDVVSSWRWALPILTEAKYLAVNT